MLSAGHLLRPDDSYSPCVSFDPSTTSLPTSATGLNGAGRDEPWSWPRAAYVHVPFCAHKCGYCDFASLAGAKVTVVGYPIQLDYRDVATTLEVRKDPLLPLLQIVDVETLQPSPSSS